MPAKKYDFVQKPNSDGNACEAGADFSWQMIWEKRPDPITPIPETDYEPDDTTYVPVPLDGYEARMQVRKKAGDPVIIELTTMNQRIVLGGAAGTIDLRIKAIDTEPLPPGIFRYDLELIDPNGFVTRFLQGIFEIVANITE